MRGKPFLVAVASFAIVLLGGAAIAGIGTYSEVGNPPNAAYKSQDTQVTPTTLAPEQTTTTRNPSRKRSRKKNRLKRNPKM